MEKVVRGALGALVVVLVVNMLWATSHRRRPAGHGAVAPAFVVPLATGGEFRVKEGRAALIDFWASWCGPCRGQLPTVDRLAARYRDRVDFVALNVEPVGARADVDAYLTKAGLAMPVGLDGERVAAQFQVDVLPHTVVVDREGKVRQVFVGPADEAELVDALEEVVR
jgi:thiol-disulfide isomerase/thioredoxin